MVSGDVVGSEANVSRVWDAVWGGGSVEGLELGAFVKVGHFERSTNDEDSPGRFRQGGVVDFQSDDGFVCEAAKCWAVAHADDDVASKVLVGDGQYCWERADGKAHSADMSAGEQRFTSVLGKARKGIIEEHVPEWSSVLKVGVRGEGHHSGAPGEDRRAEVAPFG